MGESCLVALGGHAMASLEAALAPVAELVRRGCRVALTHGNGPQVGEALARAEAAGERVPLDVCVAQTQGELGYRIQQTLQNLLLRSHIVCTVVTVVCRAVVEPDGRPTKPIGPVLSEAQARALAERDVPTADDPGRGRRRVVASPRPVEIVEAETVRLLFAAGTLVIAAGGGGVPVRRTPGGFEGVEAVVDKDRSSALLAVHLGATLLIDLTSIDSARLNFGRPDERPIESMTVSEARAYLAAGHFHPGSMGPKVEAAAEFVERSGGRAILTTPGRLLEALEGRAGTRIVP